MPTLAPPPFIATESWQVVLVVVTCAFSSQVIRVRASGYRVPWGRTVWRGLAAALTALVAYGLIDAVHPLGFLATCSVSIGVGWVGSSLMQPLTRIALERNGISVPDEAREASREVKKS
jgi:hypothetical protein